MKASCDINYCVVDTIIDNGHLQFFWDRKYHFFLVRDNLHLEVMGVDFMNKLYGLQKDIESRLTRQIDRKIYQRGNYLLEQYREKVENILLEPYYKFTIDH